jgi:putative ABC transport system ATP-binding protein
VVPDVADPTDGGDLPAGSLDIRFEAVAFAYPHGPEVLHDVSVALPARARVAVVGETGSGKTTFAKLLTRLMDPTRGVIRVGGVALPTVRFAALRRRIVMVPQDGFLFDATIAENVRFGRPGLTDEEILTALSGLDLTDWIGSLPAGIQTVVGERGESLSVGERQLVSLVRAHVADPDLLVLDEATSAVDPATEVRLQRAIDGLTRGRTSVAIAHRLSTAEAADEVVVVDRGRVVERGPHRELVDAGGVYSGLHASWVAQQGA